MTFFKLSQKTVLISLILLTTACQEKVNNTVHLTGKLINWGNAQKVLNSDAIASDFGLATNHSIETDDQGVFELFFDLEEGTYFSLGRNKLFLQPGDELYLEVDYRDPEKAIFQGTHQDLQSYLASVPFPKAGSYLEGGRNLMTDDIEDVVLLARERTEERRQLLAQLTATSDFLRLEELRLKLDQINSLLSYPIYGSFKGYWKADDVQKGEILLPVKTLLNELTKDIMQDEHMVHPHFRGMLYELTDAHLKANGIFSSLQMTPLMQSYDQFGALVKQLELEGLTVENQKLMEEYLRVSTSDAYTAMAQMKLKEYELLRNGQPAIALIFKDALSTSRRLSDFKGKMIYVDLWATWCGPCIDELPALEELKGSYADQPIVFLPISIDSDEEAWQNFIIRNERSLDKEFIINRSALDAYKLITIPRYFLIDADFKIVTVFAPKPSDPQLKELLDDELSKLEL